MRERENENAYKGFVGKPEKTTKKTKMRWEVSIRMKLRGIGWTGWDSSDSG
jgi:hypothetical protein